MTRLTLVDGCPGTVGHANLDAVSLRESVEAAQERAWCSRPVRAERDLASAAARVALALEAYVSEREWLSDPFPTLNRVAAGAIPISRERAALDGAISSVTHAIDSPRPRSSEIVFAVALTAQTDIEVAVAAGLALRFLQGKGDVKAADALARSLLDVDATVPPMTNEDHAAD